MQDGSLSSGESGAGAEKATPQPAAPERQPAKDVGDVAETPGIESGLGEQDTELGFLQDADIDEGSEPEGTDGFEDYDKTLEDAGADKGADEEVADDEKAAREVDEAVAAKDSEGDSEAAEKDAASESGEETPSEKFSFGGEEFDTKEAAEQNFKSLRGQFKPLQEQLELLRNANNSYELRFQRDELEKVKQGTGAQQQPQGSADAEPGKKPESSGADAAAEIITKGIDWKMVESIREKDGDNAALQWALYEGLTQLNDRFETKLKDGQSEFKEFQQVNQARQLAADTFVEARSYVDSDGQSLYPEFQDEAATQEIVNIWKRLDLAPEKAHSPAGVYFAVLAYRDLKGQLGQRGKKETPAPTPPAAGAETDPVVAAVAAAQKAGDAVAPGTERAPGKKSKLPDSERAAQAILEAGLNDDPELGFSF